MPTTTNYGWTTPADTDLVKDGASAIRTLGTAIDTTVFNNASAAIAKTIVDAKGDLIVASGADAVARLAVGTNNHVLTADSAATNGIKWAALPAAGGTSNYSLLNTGGTALTGAATITVSGISGMEKLIVIVDSASSANASSSMSIRINADSGNNYYYGGMKWQADSTEYFTALLSNSYRTNTDSIFLGQMGTNAATQVGIGLFIDGGTTTGGKGFSGNGGKSGTQFSTGGHYTVINGVYLGSAAITSISILSSTGNFDNGTIYVYGSA